MPISKVSQAGLSSGAQFNGFKNRIINGDMRIDQRNAGAAVSINANSVIYSVDRFAGVAEAADGVFSLQQDTLAPSGFINSLKATTTTADASLGATQRYIILQRIEGFNFADLGWGTASAATVTLSFWVRSSLTGTFGGSLRNSAGDRSYPYSYTISAANTWEQKSVTIPGNTTGTWLTNNGIGVNLIFTLGAGSSVSGTAGAWVGSSLFSATDAINLMATLNATFYITGVQLEKGSTATSFDYRPYGTELALCQRYYYRTTPGAGDRWFGSAQVSSSTTCYADVPFPVPMRSAPSALEQSGTASDYRVWASGAGTVTCSGVPAFYNASTMASTITGTVASGITAGNATTLRASNATAYLGWSAEL